MKHWLHESTNPAFQFAYLFGVLVGYVCATHWPIPIWQEAIGLVGIMLTFVLIHKMTR